MSESSSNLHPLRKMRLVRGLSIAEFCKVINWSEDVLGKVERGQMVAGDRVVGRLAGALGLSFDDARRLADGEEIEGIESFVSLDSDVGGHTDATFGRTDGSGVSKTIPESQAV